jgi:transposase-like protein
MAQNAQMELAIAHLKAQKQPNIAAAAREFGVARQTLSSRFYGKSVSREQAAVDVQLKLSPTQEEALIVILTS